MIQAAGLTVYVATLALFTGLLITTLSAGLGSVQSVALAFSTLCAVVATVSMLIDAVDLWIRGRRMTPYNVKVFRSLTFVAVLGALGSSIVARGAMLVVFLAPAMIVYLFIARRRPDQGPTGGRPASATSGSRGATRAAGTRQRRGGKKHK